MIATITVLSNPDIVPVAIETGYSEIEVGPQLRHCDWCGEARTWDDVDEKAQCSNAFCITHHS